MTASTDVAPRRAGQRLAARYYALHPSYRLLLRWALITVLTIVAFQASIASLVQTTRGGGLGGFVWTVVVVGILVALGVSRWHRTELPIHDRQTDVIVGTMGLVLALLIQRRVAPAVRAVLPSVAAGPGGDVAVRTQREHRPVRTASGRQVRVGLGHGAAAGLPAALLPPGHRPRWRQGGRGRRHAGDLGRGNGHRARPDLPAWLDRFTRLLGLRCDGPAGHDDLLLRRATAGLSADSGGDDDVRGGRRVLPARPSRSTKAAVGPQGRAARRPPGVGRRARRGRRRDRTRLRASPADGGCHGRRRRERRCAAAG